jgi:hypothetical protein
MAASGLSKLYDERRMPKIQWSKAHCQIKRKFGLQAGRQKSYHPIGFEVDPRWWLQGWRRRRLRRKSRPSRSAWPTNLP